EDVPVSPGRGRTVLRAAAAQGVVDDAVLGEQPHQLLRVGAAAAGAPRRCGPHLCAGQRAVRARGPGEAVHRGRAGIRRGGAGRAEERGSENCAEQCGSHVRHAIVRTPFWTDFRGRRNRGVSEISLRGYVERWTFMERGNIPDLPDCKYCPAVHLVGALLRRPGGQGRSASSLRRLVIARETVDFSVPTLMPRIWAISRSDMSS